MLDRRRIEPPPSSGPSPPRTSAPPLSSRHRRRRHRPNGFGLRVDPGRRHPQPHDRARHRRPLDQRPNHLDRPRHPQHPRRRAGTRRIGSHRDTSRCRRASRRPRVLDNTNPSTTNLTGCADAPVPTPAWPACGPAPSSTASRGELLHGLAQVSQQPSESNRPVPPGRADVTLHAVGPQDDVQRSEPPYSATPREHRN